MYSVTLVCLCLRPKLVDMADCPEGCDLAGEQLVLAACSTQGDGVPPAEAREFCDWLQSQAAPKLQGTAFAVCALGDRWASGLCHGLALVLYQAGRATPVSALGDRRVHRYKL